MDACTGRHKRNENESNRKRQNPDMRYSSSSKREKHQRLLNETIQQNEAPSSTKFFNIPLEMLDIILQRSYLHWILNSSEKQRDEEVIRSLISVDVCFNQRITRKRFKKAIWRYLKDFYRKTEKISAIIRNNRNYLLENIQPSYELISQLLSFNCITEEQSHFIQRQRSNQDKNAELLYVVEPLDEKKCSNFVKCLRQTNQKTVARIIENGGGVIKVDVQIRGAKYTTSIETQKLHQKIEDLGNETKPRSHQTDKLISQLKDKGIEILNSHLGRQTVVVWICCHLQAALEHIRKLYESNQLKEVFFENIQPSTSKLINIDSNQFKNPVVLCQISINFIKRIDVGRNENVHGVTKLRNAIYVLCRSSVDAPTVISVFEDRNPFRLQKKIAIKEIKSPVDIGSSEKENCLYVSDSLENCMWKITKKTNGKYEIKGLKTHNQPHTLSMSSGGQLSVVSEKSCILMINAELIQSIQLPRYIKNPRHVVETSIGNLIILHRLEEKEDNGQLWSIGRRRAMKSVVSELTRDGQMVIRRFIPSNEAQELKNPFYLSLDSDDRVFVADTENDRVILLDCDLQWNRIFCPTKEVEEDKEEEEEDDDETKIQRPWRLCYDEEKKQLFVGAYGVNVYTLSRK